MTTYWVWQQVGRGSKSTNVRCWQRYRSRRIETYGRYWGIAGMMSELGVRRGKAALSSGCKSHPANAPAGSNRSSHGGNEMAEAFGIARHELVTARVCRP